MISQQLLNALNEQKKYKNKQMQQDKLLEKQYVDLQLQEAIKQENIRKNYLNSIKNFQTKNERIQEMHFNKLGSNILKTKKFNDEKSIQKEEQDALDRLHKQEAIAFK